MARAKRPLSACETDWECVRNVFVHETKKGNSLCESCLCQVRQFVIFTMGGISITLTYRSDYISKFVVLVATFHSTNLFDYSAFLVTNKAGSVRNSISVAGDKTQHLHRRTTVSGIKIGGESSTLLSVFGGQQCRRRILGIKILHRDKPSVGVLVVVGVQHLRADQFTVQPQTVLSVALVSGVESGRIFPFQFEIFFCNLIHSTK